LPYLGKASLVRLPLRQPLAPFCSLLFSILTHIRLPSSSSTSPPPFLSLSFFHNLANTDTLIPLGSITLLRLHLVDIHVHDSISTFAPSTDPSFSNLHSADFDQHTLLFPARYSEAFIPHFHQLLIHPIFIDSTLLSTLDCTLASAKHTLFKSLTRSPSIKEKDDYAIARSLYSRIFGLIGARIAKIRDLGLHSKHVRHVARRRSHQNVLHTKPYRVKLRQQHFSIPPTATEKYFDTAAKESKATTRYSGPISHT
jgi:hypothetical protein